MEKTRGYTLKIFIASLGTETNTFSPFLTGYRNFEDTYLMRGALTATSHSSLPYRQINHDLWPLSGNA